MTQVAEVMTRGVKFMSPSDTLRIAALAMDELNVGALPVWHEDRVVGVITDRDITVRGVAQGLAVNDTPVGEVMSAPVECCREDDDLEDVASQMETRQVRRVVVLDREERLVGMLSLGDIAAKADSDGVGDTLAAISDPAGPDRSDAVASGSDHPAAANAGSPDDADADDESEDEQADGGDKSLDDNGADADGGASANGATSSESESQALPGTRSTNT